MHDITKPLRLATGSHSPGSGKGCVMNVISWQNGDTTITDLPDCTDPMLARVMQRVNDRYCAHVEDGLLCAECSVKVIELGNRTIGSAGKAKKAHYVAIARRMANEAKTAADAYAAADAAAAVAAAYAAYAAAYAAAAAYAVAVANAAAAAANAAAAAYYANKATRADQVEHAHHVIDVFCEIAGWDGKAEPLPLDFEQAADKMLAVS